MGMTLDKVVPWGRSYDEYVAMFALTSDDLNRRLLGCGDGPAAFNAEVTRRGGRIISIDPIYQFSSAQIRQRIAEIYDTVMTQVSANQADFVWKNISSVEQLGKVRMTAMETFLADFAAGKQQGRYLAAELPVLPLASDSCDLALSSHFLFLYSAHLSAEFHLQALLEMLRVAREVRVFPLLTLDGIVSPHLEPVREQLAKRGFGSSMVRVDYEFQRNANEMLVITPAC